MSVGDTMLIAGTIAVAGAAISRAIALRSGDRMLLNVSAMFSLLTFATVTAALLFLAYLFLASDMSYHYVWLNSSADLSSVYKLSGVWAGAEGSFLLWIWMMTLVLAVEVMLEPRRKYLSSRFHGMFQIALTGIVFFFLLLLLNMDLFVGTRERLLQEHTVADVEWYMGAYPDGWGMNLLLQTPEMIVHPPVVFAGYAFCVAAFAAAIAYFASGERNWSKISLPWARLGWLFLTLGIGIGAIWAYYVLGWGGYWGWDPVETSSLLPWLVATAFLHTQVRHVRNGEYKIVSPTLGMLSFVSVVFATFVTRAGSIWTASVHAFGGAEGETAGARLSYLLQNDDTILGIFTLLLASFVLAIYLAYAKYTSESRPEEQPEPKRLSEYIGDKNNMLLTVFLLIATGGVMLLLLFKNVDVSQTVNYAEFNQKISIFFVGITITMTMCLLWRYVGKERAFWLATGMIVFSVILLIVAIASDSFDSLVAFSAPSYVVAIGASVYKLAKSVVKGSFRKTLQQASPHLIHLGVALVLMSYVVSSMMQTYPADMDNLGGVEGNTLSVGSEFDVGDYTVKLVSLTSREEQQILGGGNVVTGSLEAEFDIMRGDDHLRTATLSDLYGLSTGGRPKVLEVEVYVYKSAFSDLYLNYQWVNNNTAFVQAKVVPLMNTLWGGFGLLAVGLVLRLSAWQQRPEEAEVPRKPLKAPVAKKPSEPAKPKKDYEAVVEEELRKFKEKKKAK